MKLFNLMSALLLLSSTPAVVTAANANPPAGGNVIQSVADLRNPYEMEICKPLDMGGKTLPHMRGVNRNASSASFANPNARKTPVLPLVTEDDVTTMPKVIKGSLYWDDNWKSQEWGMYSLPANGGNFTLLTSEEKFKYLDYVANGGGTPFGDGKYFMVSFSMTDDMQGIKQVMATTWDSETWEVVTNKLQTVEKDGQKYPDVTKVASAMAYDKTTGSIYGCFLREDMTGYAMGIIDPYKYNKTTIANLADDVYWVACCFDAQGQLYALDEKGDFYKVNKTTGEQTRVGNIGVSLKYSTSGSINPDDNKFYVISTDDVNGGQNSKLYRFDLATAAAEEVYDFGRAVEMYGMYFSSPARSALAPAAVKDLACDFEGGREATATFTAPTENVAGDALTGLLKVKVSVNYVPIYDGRARPGAAVSVPISVEEDGLQRIEVVISNSYGDGPAAMLSVYSGVVPGRALAPRNLTVTRDANDLGTLNVKWDHPDTDENGNPVMIDNSNFAYRVFGRTVSGWLLNNYTGTSFVYRLNDFRDIANDFSKTQMFETITAWTGTDLGGGYDYGFNSDFYASSPLISVGRPYDLPWQEPITQNGLIYNWINTTDPDHGEYVYASEKVTSRYTVRPYDNDGGMFVFIPYHKATEPYGELRCGDINLGNAENPMLSFQLFRSRKAYNEDQLVVFVFERNDEVEDGKATPLVQMKFPVFIDDATEPDAEDGWNLCEVPLEAAKGKTVYFTFFSICGSLNSAIALDNVEVRNCSDYDLSANQLTTPGELIPGRETSFGVSIRNWGAAPVEGSVVNLLCEGEVVATKTVDRIEGGKVVNVLFDVTPTSLLPDQVGYSAEVLFDKDPDTSNNRTAPVMIDVIKYTHPAPEALDGKFADEDLLLSWGEPVFTPVEKVTDDFESYTPYVIDRFGDWVGIDFDCNKVFTVGDGNYENAGVPQSWTVFTHSDYPAYSGNNMIAAFAGAFGMSPDEGQYSDNCLISPKMSGNGQTVTFYARCVDPTRNSDALEVYYSSKTDDSRDFVDDNLLEYINNIPSKWTKKTVTVPEGALYLMFRHSGPAKTTSYGIMLDDVTYEKYGNDNLTMLGYNIYCNGVRLNNEPLEDTEFMVTGGKQKDGRYVVTTVYKEGESVPSDAFVYSPSGVEEISGVAAISVRSAKGAIMVNGAQGNVSVYDINGRVVASAAGAELRFNVEKGVYLVNCGTKTFKVLVD